MANKLKFFGFIFVAFVALGGLNSCASLKSGGGNAQTESAVGKLSSAIQQMDTKMPIFVQQVFADPKNVKSIVKEQVDQLQEPLTGFAGVMFTEWQTYSQERANVDNANYKPFSISLPKAKGPLSSRICAAVNSNLTKVFDQSRASWKKCRVSGEAEACKKKFEEDVTKQLSTIIGKVVEDYCMERYNQL